MLNKRQTVAEAVTSFVVVFGNSPHACERLVSVAENLRRSRDWSADEVEDFRRQVEERLHLTSAAV